MSKTFKFVIVFELCFVLALLLLWQVHSSVNSAFSQWQRQKATVDVVSQAERDFPETDKIVSEVFQTEKGPVILVALPAIDLPPEYTGYWQVTWVSQSRTVRFPNRIPLGEEGSQLVGFSDGWVYFAPHKLIYAVVDGPTDAYYIYRGEFEVRPYEKGYAVSWYGVDVLVGWKALDFCLVHCG